MLTSLFKCGINRFKIQSTCCADLESSLMFLHMKPMKAHTTGTNNQWRRLAPKQLYTKTQTQGHSGHPAALKHGYWAHQKTITDATCSTFQKQEDTGYQAQQTCSHNTACPPNIHSNHTSGSSPKSYKLT
jgi:hypothetical protein